jgi:hypothetical protein
MQIPTSSASGTYNRTLVLPNETFVRPLSALKKAFLFLLAERLPMQNAVFTNHI